MSHKHKDLIIAWANGAKIEVFDPSLDEWCPSSYPSWLEENSYRLKKKESTYDDPTDDIDEILDCFNFEKVKKVMDFLNWEWFGSNGVPEIYELRQHARKLMNTAVTECIKSKHQDYFTECGGFRVECNKYEDDPKMYIRLSFNLESLENWD